MLLDARWISRPHRRVSSLEGAIILSPNPSDYTRLVDGGLKVLLNHQCNLGIPNLIVNNTDRLLRGANTLTLKTVRPIREMDKYFRKAVVIHYYNVRSDNPKVGYLYRVQYRTADSTMTYKVPLLSNTTPSSLSLIPALILNAAKGKVSHQCLADLRLYTSTWDRLRNIRYTGEALHGSVSQCIETLQTHLVSNWMAPSETHDKFFLNMMKSCPDRASPHPLDWQTAEGLLKTYTRLSDILQWYNGPQLDISPCHSMWNATYPADCINNITSFGDLLTAVCAIPLTDFRITARLDPNITVRDSVIEYAVDRFAPVLTDSRLASVRLDMLEVLCSGVVRKLAAFVGFGPDDWDGSVTIERSYDDEVSMRVDRNSKQPIVLYFDLLACDTISPVDVVDTFANTSLYQFLETEHRDVDGWL